MPQAPNLVRVDVDTTTIDEMLAENINEKLKKEEYEKIVRMVEYNPWLYEALKDYFKEKDKEKLHERVEILERKLEGK